MITKIVLTGGPCAGKTTTNERIEEVFSKPRYAVVCFIEGGESGGKVAGPLVGKMLAYLLGQNSGELR